MSEAERMIESLRRAGHRERHIQDLMLLVDPLFARLKAAERALKQADDALESIWAAIGDALCSGKGIVKKYGQKVASEVREAQEQIRATQAGGEGEG